MLNFNTKKGICSRIFVWMFCFQKISKPTSKFTIPTKVSTFAHLVSPNFRGNVCSHQYWAKFGEWGLMRHGIGRNLLLLHYTHSFLPQLYSHLEEQETIYRIVTIDIPHKSVNSIQYLYMVQQLKTHNSLNLNLSAFPGEVVNLVCFDR